MGTTQSKEYASASESNQAFTNETGQRENIDIIVTQGNKTAMFTTLPLRRAQRRSTSEDAPGKSGSRSSLKRKFIVTTPNLRSSSLSPRRAKTPSLGQSPTFQSRTSSAKQTSSVTTKVASREAVKSPSIQQATGSRSTTSPRTTVKSVVSSKIQKLRVTSPAVKSIIRMHTSQSPLKGSTLSGGSQKLRGLISPITKSRVTVASSKVVISPHALSKSNVSPRVQFINKISPKTPSSPLKLTPIARPTVKSIASPRLQQAMKIGSPIVKSRGGVTPPKTSVSHTPTSVKLLKRKSISPSHSTPKKSRASPPKKKSISPGSTKGKSPASSGNLEKNVKATPPGGKSRIIASSKAGRSPLVSLTSSKSITVKTSPKPKVKLSPLKSSPARTPVKSASPRLQKFKIRTSPLVKSVLKLTPSRAISSPRTPLSAKLQKKKAASPVKKLTPKTSSSSSGCKIKLKKSPVVKLKSPKRSPVKITPKKSPLSQVKKMKISPSKQKTKVVSPGAVKNSSKLIKAKSPLGKGTSSSARPKASPMKSPLKRVILLKKNSPKQKIKLKSPKSHMKNKSPVTMRKTIAKVLKASSPKKSPSSQKMSPKSQKMSSKSQKMSPKSQKMSPKSQKMSPKSQKMSPKSQKMSPKSQKVSPNSKKMSPKSQKPSPKLQKISPKPQKTSPNTKPASPKSPRNSNAIASTPVKTTSSKPSKALSISAANFYSSPTSSKRGPSQVQKKWTLKTTKTNELAATPKREMKHKQATLTGSLDITASSSPYARRIAPFLEALNLRANTTPIPFMQPCSVLLNSNVVRSYFLAKTKKQKKRVRFQLVKVKRLQPKPVPIQVPNRKTRNNPTGRGKQQQPPKRGSSRGGH